MRMVNACTRLLFILSLSDTDQRRPHWQQLSVLLPTCAKIGDRVLRGIFTRRLQDGIRISEAGYAGPKEAVSTERATAIQGESAGSA